MKSGNRSRTQCQQIGFDTIVLADQADPVAAMALEPAGKIEFDQDQLDLSGGSRRKTG